MCIVEKTVTMKTLFVTTGEEKVPHVLYNKNIPIDQRAKLENILFFPSALSVANFLGVPPQRVFFKRTGGSIKSKINHINYAVRIANEQQIQFFNTQKQKETCNSSAH